MMLFDWIAALWALHAHVVIPAGGPILAAGYGTSIAIALAVSLVSTAVSMGVNALLAPNLKGPRQKDAGIQTDDYGAPIQWSFGPLNRVTGTVIWYSGLKETKRKQSGSGGSQTTFTYYCSAAILLGKAKPGAVLLRAWANKKLIYDRGAPIGFLPDGTLKVVGAITLHDGAADQDPDPTLEEEMGVGNVPAYRHSMYVVVRNLQLADFGPRLPMLEFEIQADEDITAKEVVEQVGEAAGVEIDTALLDGAVGPLDGYTINQHVTALDALVPLGLAYAFMVAERAGRMVALPLGMAPVADIPRDDLGAVEYSSGAAASIPEHQRLPDSDLPRSASVTYRDIARDHQPSTQRVERSVGSSSENSTVDLPVVLDADQARQVAARLLFAAVAVRRTMRMAVSDRWLDVLPGDIVNVPTPVGHLIPAMLAKSTRGANGVIEWDLQAEDNEVVLNLCPTAGGETVEPTTPTTGASGKTVFQPLDIPILRDSHSDAGFYFCASGKRDAWPGALVFRSTDGGTDYEPMGQGLRGTTIGEVVAATPDGPTYCWDLATTIRVEVLSNDELESKSELAVLNGANTAWLGSSDGRRGEIIQFTTATLVQEGTYDLSGLLRGRRGTEWATGLHSPGERFVLLSDSPYLIRQDFGLADLDLPRLYKPVTAGDGLAETTAVTFTNGGEGLRPFAPVHLAGRRRSDDSIQIAWIARTRLMHGGFGSGPLPVGEEAESFQLDIHREHDVWELGASYVVGNIRRLQSAYDYGWRVYRAKRDHTATRANRPDQASANWAANWVEVPPLRTVFLADQTAYAYSAAAQVDDGLTLGTPVWLQVRQRSAARGFGHPASTVA